MNEKIIHFLKTVIGEKGIRYTVLAERSGIHYQRLMRIFHQGAAIRGSELLALCWQLQIDQTQLMALLDEESWPGV